MRFAVRFLTGVLIMQVLHHYRLYNPCWNWYDTWAA